MSTYEYISLEAEEVKSTITSHLQSPYSYMLKIFPCLIPGLFLVHHSGKESAGCVGDLGSMSGLGRSPGREWLATPVFLPGKSHGQWRLVGYSPWVAKSQM